MCNIHKMSASIKQTLDIAVKSQTLVQQHDDMLNEPNDLGHQASVTLGRPSIHPFLPLIQD